MVTKDRLGQDRLGGIKIGVATDDVALARKIYIALLGAAEVEMLSPTESGGQFDITLVDLRCGGRDIASGIIPIVARAAWVEGERALPYPFAYSELRELVSGLSAQRLVIEGERTVSLDGKRIRLTESEHRLISAIAEGGGEFVSREELAERVFGKGAESGILNVYIHYLREKLEGGGEKIILSSRRGGYRIDEKYLGVKN